MIHSTIVNYNCIGHSQNHATFVDNPKSHYRALVSTISETKKYNKLHLYWSNHTATYFQFTRTHNITLPKGKAREATRSGKKKKKGFMKKNEDRHRAVVVKQQSEVRKRNDTRVTNYFIFRFSGSENKNSHKSEIK